MKIDQNLVYKTREHDLFRKSAPQIILKFQQSDENASLLFCLQVGFCASNYALFDVSQIQINDAYDVLIPKNEVIFLQNQYMSGVESHKYTGRLNRKYSEMTIDTRLTRCSFYQRESPERVSRRKVSFDHKNKEQREDDEKHEQKRLLQAKCNFRLSTQVLSFEMEQQRNHQLRIIHSNPQLLAYYNCLKKLFMILYQASIPLAQNQFNITAETLTNNNLQILAVLFDQQPSEWTFKYFQSLKNFAHNMAMLSANSHQFQRRMELVGIKSCLHNEKRPKIEKAFLNTRIEAYWKQIEQKFGEMEVFSFIEDQFEKAEEKLCFIEIQQFVKSKLSSEAFGDMLRRYCQLEEIDHDMNLSFKFQFFMAEELCFNSLTDLFKEDNEEPSGICEIM